MKIRINEVSPRDGLQSQGKTLSVESRLSLIQALVNAGLENVEAGSFVSPKAVPQMAGTDKLFARLPDQNTVRYAGLVPNMKGYELAVSAGAKVVNVVLSVTETMNQENIRMSLLQTVEVCTAIIERGKREGVEVQAYLAVAFECPFEGLVEPAVVARFAKLVKQAGASKIIIADTIGAANPEHVKRLLDAVTGEVGSDILSCHFHDTRGMALANITVAVEHGVREFDSSIGGLGGCPFSPGATGNVATEDVVLLLNSMGHDTGIDPLDLISVVNLAEQLTGVSLGGKSFRWLSQQASKAAAEIAHGG